MPTKNKLKINILLDTSVIFTESVSYLFRKEITDLIRSHIKPTDIELIWYIPQIVIQERIFQMKKKGYELLPAIEKIEGLLGHKLNINKEIVDQRVEENVRRQMNNFFVDEVKTNIANINWESIIHKSVNRLPPFEDNKKEKGFRDALVLESLNQLISISPSSQQLCRIIFVANDDVLNVAATEIAKSKTNVKIVKQIDDLVSLINIFNSQITEEFISTITKGAGDLFMIIGDKSTLFYSYNVLDRIIEKFPIQLEKPSTGYSQRDILNWEVNKPGFEQKVRQKVTWKTIISAKIQDSKKANLDFNPIWVPISSRFNNPYISSPNPVLDIRNPLGNLDLGGNAPLDIWKTNSIEKPKEFVHLGYVKFEVIWTLTLASNGKLTKPQIIDIRYIDTIMDDLPTISS